MHESQNEERQQQQHQEQHMCSPPSQRSSVENPADQRVFTKDGRALNIGDCALFQSGNDLPFIGILRKVTLETVDQVKLTVNWLYREKDIKLAKGSVPEAEPNEIFYSFHRDVIPEATLLHPCRVAFLQEGVEVPTGVSFGFACRRVYDTANKRLYWLSDRDYTNEHQEEVDELLDRTKLEMQAATQTGGPSPRNLTGSATVQLLKGVSESVQNGSYSAAGKCKKRERSDQNVDLTKRERNLKPEDAEGSPLKRERSMKPEEIITNLDKDGGLVDLTGVESLVQQMQQDQNDGSKKVADVTNRRTKLANIIAATEKEECLTGFLKLGGLRLLDEWLQEAHKGKVGDVGSPREGDKSVEELLLGLLRALDKLPVDLNALKTCVVGKSVNHLRGHKNVEIQKKARKLVDVWKKRVDSEMKLSGEGKPTGGNGIWSSCKLPQSEPVHNISMKDSSGPLEVVVKTSVATAGNAKDVQNGPSSGDGPAKTPEVSGKVGSPPLPAGKDSSSKLPAVNFGSDVHADMVKDEKSSCSSHSLSNGHYLVSGTEKSATTPRKEEVKNGVVVSGKSGGSSSGLPSLGQSGVNASGGLKEAGSDKPTVWSKNTASEKAGSPVGGAEKDVESGGSQQRLIVRIPNPARSPAPTSGGTDDDHVSRSSSPSASELQTSANFDKSHQNEATEITNPSARPSRPAPMDTADGAMGLLATVAAAAEESGGEFLNNVDSTGQADTRMDAIVQRTKHEDTGATQSYADHDPSPSVGPGDGKSVRKEQQIASVAPEQSAVAEKTVERHSLRRDAASGEGIRMDSSSAKLTVDHPCLKEHKVKDINGLESKPAGFDGQLSSKYGTRTGERGLSRTHSKVSKSAIELCNGIGVGLGDFRSPFGVASVEHLKDERPGRKRGQEVGQLFGRRSESDAHRIADLGFPEEDVLEVARQAADEVEQMEKYGKPVSSSLSDRDAHENRHVGISSATETRDLGVADAAGRDRMPSVVLDNAKNAKASTLDQRYSEINVRMHFDDTREDTEHKIGGTAEATAGSLEGHEPDASISGQRGVVVSASSPIAQESYVSLETSPQDSRGVNPNTPQQAVESCGPVEGPVGRSEVAERPIFDLNEGFMGDDSPQDDAATPLPVSGPSTLVHPIASGASASAVAAPIAVLVATKGAFIPPASPLRIEGDRGWKGSAATSAFRPAEPRRTPERLNSNGESMASDGSLAMTAISQKRARPLLEFDLNVADERVTHDAVISATTLSSQGSVLGMSLHSNSVPSSLVSGLTCVKPESSRVAFLKPESSSSAYPLSNGGSGPLRSSQGQVPPTIGQGVMRSTLDLDLNRMDDSEDNCVPLSVDPRGIMEGIGSSARSNNSTTQQQSQPPPQPPRRPMDFDLNDGPSLEESGSEEPAVHPFMLRKPPAGIVGSSVMTLTGLRMGGGDTMSLSPWAFTVSGNGNPGVAVPHSGFAVANAPAPHSFLNSSAGAGPFPASAAAGSGVSGEMFGAGGLGFAPPTVVYPGSERMTFGGPHVPYPMLGNSPGFLSSSAPFPVTSTPFGEMPNSLPFTSMSSQPLVTPGTMTSPYLMGMTEMGPVGNVGPEHAWSRLSLDLNSGPEAGESEGTREDVLHGRLPPLHPGAPPFSDFSATLAQVAASSNTPLPPPVKRKEPEGGWNLHSGVGIYKQSTWR